MSRKQKDNGSYSVKQRQRLAKTSGLTADTRVFEGFCGEGRIYRGAWCRFERGVCLDKVESKVRSAAFERPGWACYQGDTERAIIGGLAADVQFGIVDLDAYGSPWPFLRAWMTSDRDHAPLARVFLMDGYMSQASISRSCRALFPERAGQQGDTPPEYYLERVKSRLAEWGRERGLVASELETVKHARMRLHYLELSKAG